MTETTRPVSKPSRGVVLRLLGPGLVTGAADDDPSGIATYSQAGAQFGYGLLWTVFLTIPFMIAIQLVSALIGRVTGKGLAANVMEIAPRWLVLALVFLLVAANTINIAADIAAMAEALSLVIGGLNHEHALIFASASTLLQVFVPYRRYSPALKFLTLTLFAYVATAFMVEIPVVYRAACDGLAESERERGVLPDGGGRSRHDHQPLSVFLAGVTGSRGDAQGQGTPPAPRADTRWLSRNRPHQDRYDGRHVLLQCHRLLHHPDHRIRAACARRHQHQFGDRGGGSIAAAGRRRDVRAVRARHHRHRSSRNPGAGGLCSLWRSPRSSAGPQLSKPRRRMRLASTASSQPQPQSASDWASPGSTPFTCWCGARCSTASSPCPSWR